ncbi:hypothetical protein JI435_441320 [Parastagonospora nodorum SN15]|uniref:Tyrosinase copper-binding domain-containing protein n=1 Tax=Phaeosphaeria nodorum (strain SN15 / ATCC MYA-4574 / FGSC 10173) TaxID=321614 RepID=A0A7U2FCU0_PHANO|nr:hypothetical protein HBH71_140350 [Parastagonospora nodorum]QRD02879.1 hypothetical protein JI435_441320 [Parastagonospora nodorum SN15]
MNMTPMVHATANFMHWHRVYIFAYETALRQECDYKGYQPYWDWSKYPDLVNSPIFNGDDWSMGGNGDHVPHKGMQFGPGTAELVPAGPGGGCVTTGPLANLTIHLGPLASTMDPELGIKPNPRPADGYGDNPRCHRRDVNNYFTSKFLKPDDLLKQITSSPDILTFQNTLQNSNEPMAALHIGGHFSIWGDPGGDVFVSPNEPTFWLHHGQLDRHWWIWANYQDKEIAKRTVQYEGGTNWIDPNSAKGKPEDPQWLNVVAPAGMEELAAREMFSTTSGPFCYVYE